MTALPKRRAGQPIMVFLALILGWTGLRIAIWESPFPKFPLPDLAASPPFPSSNVTPPSMAAAPANVQGVPDLWTFEGTGQIAPPRTVEVDLPPFVPVRDNEGALVQPTLVASHQLLFLAAMGQVPVPSEIARVMSERLSEGRTRASSDGVEITGKGTRWSMDGWLFLRPDAAVSANTGPRFSSYGASQAGAVLRYRLKPTSGSRPTAYVRGTKALAAGRESEIAAGLSARLIPGIPASAYAEVRATRGPDKSEVRPAAFVVTEFPPVDLPLGLRGETYLAAGYVGGDFATAFVDGQARIDREVIRFDLGSLRAGAGAWGGAQKGAARLDIGPSASVNVKLGDVPARVAVDYRLRAAGDAEPGSGAAITLTTGF